MNEKRFGIVLIVIGAWLFVSGFVLSFMFHAGKDVTLDQFMLIIFGMFTLGALLCAEGSIKLFSSTTASSVKFTGALFVAAGACLLLFWYGLALVSPQDDLRNFGFLAIMTGINLIMIMWGFSFVRRSQQIA